MATTTHVAPGRVPALAAPAELLRGLRARLSQHRRYRRTLDELSRLSDRQLADLGLHRSALRAVAFEAAKSGR